MKSSFYVNGEYVKCDFEIGDMTWYHKNGKRDEYQYSLIYDMMCDLFSIILNHKMSQNELAQYNDYSYYYIYEYNHKQYRIWWYTDNSMYVQHIVDYESVDDMLDEFTNDINDILTAILNDN